MKSKFYILSSEDLSFQIVKDTEFYLKESDLCKCEEIQLKVNGGINIDIAFTDKRILFFEKNGKETARLTLPYHSINIWSAIVNDVHTSINSIEFSITIYTDGNNYKFSTFEKSFIEQIESCLIEHVL